VTSRRGEHGHENEGIHLRVRLVRGGPSALVGRRKRAEARES
jgi:hypothetical protein